jgi:hypothetical protein
MAERRISGSGYAGVKMPSDATIAGNDRAARSAAEAGSRALLEALHRYFVRHHGLPGAGA